VGRCLSRYEVTIKMAKTIVNNKEVGPLTLHNGVFVYPKELEMIRSRLPYSEITELDIYEEKCKIGGII